MKTITIAGRVGQDAVTRNTNSGNVTSFSVAVDDGYGDNKSTMWFDCSIWGKRGDAVARFLIKGTPVTVSGDLRRREHEGKTYLQIDARDLTLQGKPAQSPQQAAQQFQAPLGGAGGGLDGDDVPFAPEFR